MTWEAFNIHTEVLPPAFPQLPLGVSVRDPSLSRSQVTPTLKPLDFCVLYYAKHGEESHGVLVLEVLQFGW